MKVKGYEIEDREYIDGEKIVVQKCNPFDFVADQHERSDPVVLIKGRDF